MRACKWLAAVVVMVAVADCARAQNVAGFGGNSAGSTQTMGTRTGVTRTVGNSFGLTGILRRFQSSISTRQTINTTPNVPNPASADYLKAFGYQRLF